jgi:hypothetical protein
MTDPASSADGAPSRTPDAFLVNFKVVPLGDGRIFTGEYDPRLNRFTTYKKGQTGRAQRSIAERLERLGLVEIER